MCTRTPALANLHTDESYGSADVDEALADRPITQIQTASRGPDPAVRIDIVATDSDQESYQVSCPH